MQRIVLWVLSTVTVVVLLFGYHTSTSGPSGPGQAVHAIGSSGTGSGSGSTTVTGPVAQTRWGPVQVQVSFAGDKISDVKVVQYPNGNGRDEEINSYALPILVQSTIQANSAKVDMVSGATVTSEGYLQSLQGALDQAGR